MASTPTDRLGDVVGRRARSSAAATVAVAARLSQPIGMSLLPRSQVRIEIVAKIAKGVTARSTAPGRYQPGLVLASRSVQSDRAWVITERNPIHRMGFPRAKCGDHSGECRMHHRYREVDRHCAAGRVRPTETAPCRSSQPTRRVGIISTEAPGGD